MKTLPAAESLALSPVKVAIVAPGNPELEALLIEKFG
jgi:hypothetical protein